MTVHQKGKIMFKYRIAKMIIHGITSTWPMIFIGAATLAIGVQTGCWYILLGFGWALVIAMNRKQG